MCKNTPFGKEKNFRQGVQGAPLPHTAAHIVHPTLLDLVTPLI